jgi:predicted metal-dependent hydrolase
MLSFLKKTANDRPQDRFIDVGDRSLPLKIRPHARAKRITLRIDPGGRGLSLTIPQKLPEHEINEFLEKYHGWILTKLAKFPKDDELIEGGYIKIRGQDHLIERTGKIRGITETVQLDGEFILRVSGDVPHLKRRISDFLKSEARKDLEKSTHYHAEKIGRSFKSISLRDTKSRWGSCSSDGSLSYSWRIIMAPPFVLDYLAAHEVSHLVEMNHEPQFWQLCENLCPHTQDAKKWLKKNGSLLHAINFN